jgi:threonine synthase
MRSNRFADPILILQKSFEDVVMKGLASDGGLFIPEEIPSLPENWESWADASFEDLAFNIMSLFVSPDEVPSDDLKDIIKRSYSTFDHPERTPLVELDPEQNLFLLELWHGPTRAFKEYVYVFPAPDVK